MKSTAHLSLIVPDGQSNLSTIAGLIGAYEIFTIANGFWQKKGNEPRFKIELVGISDQTEVYGVFSVKPQVHMRDVSRTDLIIIPSLVRDYEKAMEGNQLLIDWIASQYRDGAEIASICTGAFMLASSGLLNGRNCATHWSAAETFRSRFPEVNLQADTLITDEKGIYTNGGAYSFLNLVIYLVEKYFDRETAIYCSKIFQIEMDRHSQSEFIIFKGQKEHGDDIVKKAQAYLESSLHEKISIDNLCSRFSVSRRNFDRRFIKATGNTPLEYSQRVKIEIAKKSFETTRKTISEVMYDVGYSDDKAFREVFKKFTSMSPIDYKRKYNKEA
jgi:transcriptional regulator GlxA family with amidase domain